MWIGAYEQEGRTSFFAITSDNASLGPFTTFEQAQAALQSYEQKLHGDVADHVRSLVPVHVHRQTRLGKNGLGHWVIGDAVPQLLIFFYSDEFVGEGFLVFHEDGFAFVGTHPNLPAAKEAAANAAEKINGSKTKGRTG